jgi:hypothetical protein
MEVRGQLRALYPLDRRLGGPQNRSRCCRAEKNLLHCWKSNPSHTAHSPVLSWLPRLVMEGLKLLNLADPQRLVFYKMYIIQYIFRDDTTINDFFTGKT